MALTDTAIRNSKPKEKEYKLADEKGLYLLIRPNGSKLWYLKFRFNKVESHLSFGAYLATSLAKVRELRERGCVP